MSSIGLKISCLLLSDLVGCDSPLQIVITVWHTFFKFEARQTAIIVSSGLSHPTQEVPILKEVSLLSA
jgi:hypothetical protein